MCTVSSAGGRSWPVTGVVQDVRMDFIQDWIAGCNHWLVTMYYWMWLLDCYFCFTGCINWHTTTCILRDVSAGMLLL